MNTTTCPTCEGFGFIDAGTCQVCHASNDEAMRTCEECGGTGTVNDDCPDCHGTGTVTT